MRSIPKCIVDDATNLQDLQLLNWPTLSVDEDEAVTQVSHGGTKFAVGGSAKMTKKSIDISGQAAISPG